ncbi:hypothetical protein H257_11464 [Aphanomyces astaci]|uniref:Uncharacterized protein n=1 Tax=Aphanomyces astaci TaxID=112090 RepID=W4G494_APHAT|nr:hypothetical protein H257_11464 [Aphanomyces astaci]ETV73773.1 hypothetical protein H257_11464 [Aphanomyces astaci]|eukprot:XP_009836709.1 hypothetical protein H257_11464 [Aphanomyces astaci]
MDGGEDFIKRVSRCAPVNHRLGLHVQFFAVFAAKPVALGVLGAFGKAAHGERNGHVVALLALQFPHRNQQLLVSRAVSAALPHLEAPIRAARARGLRPRRELGSVQLVGMLETHVGCDVSLVTAPWKPTRNAHDMAVAIEAIPMYDFGGVLAPRKLTILLGILDQGSIGGRWC